MKLVGDVVEIRPNRLFIPPQNRVAPSLTTNTALHGALLPGAGENRSELYLSPFPRQSWSDIWRIECEFNDRPGIMAELSRLLGGPEAGVNILSHEIMTLSHPDGVIGHIHLICDMTGYGGSANPDGDTKQREGNPDARLRYLIDFLCIHFWKDLRFHAHRPQMFAIRLRELQAIASLVRREGVEGHEAGFEATVRDGIIELPPSVWERFIRGSDRTADGRYVLTVVSDTDQRYVKITPLPRQMVFVPLEVRHTDKPGQIAAFTKLVREVGGNIFSSFLRLERAGGAAIWRCLLESPQGKEGELMANLRTGLARLAIDRDDRILAVSFPGPLREPPAPLSLWKPWTWFRTA